MGPFPFGIDMYNDIASVRRCARGDIQSTVVIVDVQGALTRVPALAVPLRQSLGHAA